MIPTPYAFEAKFSPEEFQKLGQFACRWANIEHVAANCLRVLLGFDPKQASVMIFPLSLETKMNRIENFSKIKPLSEDQAWLFAELRPLIAAMQYIRNTVLHGAAFDLSEGDEPFFLLRSKDQKITKSQLFESEDIINYTAHVIIAFRWSIGEKNSPWGPPRTLPDRPPVPSFLPERCRAFPTEKRVLPSPQPESSRA
jgi:hypothetical protein